MMNTGLKTANKNNEEKVFHGINVITYTKSTLQ